MRGRRTARRQFWEWLWEKDKNVCVHTTRGLGAPRPSFFPTSRPLLPPSRVRIRGNAGLHGLACLEEQGQLPGPLTLLPTSAPAFRSWDPRKPHPGGQPPPSCESTETRTRVSTRAPRPGLTPPRPRPPSGLLLRSPGAVASRFRVSFGEGEGFTGGTLFALGLGIPLPSEPFSKGH